MTKQRIGSKTIKHHDHPKTLYQRIMEYPHIHESVKSSLSKQLEKVKLPAASRGASYCLADILGRPLPGGDQDDLFVDKPIEMANRTLHLPRHLNTV
jgi:hypothetical protein